MHLSQLYHQQHSCCFGAPNLLCQGRLFCWSQQERGTRLCCRAETRFQKPGTPGKSLIPDLVRKSRPHLLLTQRANSEPSILKACKVAAEPKKCVLGESTCTLAFFPSTLCHRCIYSMASSLSLFVSRSSGPLQAPR